MKLLLPFLVILVSVIYGMPNVILYSRFKNEYTPFTLSSTSPIGRDESFAYGPEVNYILSERSLLKEIYIKEYSTMPTPFLGESASAATLSFFAFLTSSVPKAFIIADFIFPPVIFMGLYYFSCKFINNRVFAASAAFATVISRDFIAVIPYPLETAKYLLNQENQNYLLYFSRAFQPQISFLYFLLALIATLKIINAPKKISNTVFLGITYGLLFYTYVFNWSLFSIFYLCILIIFIAREELAIVKSMIFAGIIALCISGYYLFEIYQFYKLPSINDFVAKNSLQNVPIPATLIRYSFLAIAFLLTTKKKGLHVYTLFILLATGVLVTPISKTLIGQDLETFHYLRRIIMPFATIAMFAIIYNLQAKKKYLQNVTAIIFIFIFVTYGFRTQLIATDKIAASHKKDTDLESVFYWINHNTPKNSVVASLNPNFSSLIPLHTRNYTYFPPTDRTIMPTYEGVERYKILNQILGTDENWQKKNIDTLVSYMFVYQSYDDMRNLHLDSERRHEAERQMDILNENDNWKMKVNKYQIDYIITTPDELININPDPKYLKFITSINQYLIFKKI
ncbi:MAG: hypothetical protein AAB512_01865 [Patescibacteria group bacterium]